jgi:hypothetical protein
MSLTAMLAFRHSLLKKFSNWNLTLKDCVNKSLKSDSYGLSVL